MSDYDFSGYDRSIDNDTQSTGGSPPVDVSDYVFVSDKWLQRKGKELLLVPSDTDKKQAKEPAKNDEHVSRKPYELATDCFTSVFEPNLEFNANVKDERAKMFFEGLMEAGKFKVLRSQSICNVELSDILAKTVFKKALTYLTTTEDENKAKERIQAVKAARRCTEELCDDLAVINDLASVSESRSMRNISNVPSIFNKIKNNKKLRHIINLAGRAVRLAQSLQYAKDVKRGHSEVAGIELGGDIAKVLPSELARLGTVLEAEFISRLLNKEALQLEVSSKSERSRGPIAVLVDESGSMGDHIEKAKAICLAIMWVASHQKRWCSITSFAVDLVNDFLFPPNCKLDNDFVDWLGRHRGGGTSARVPCVRLRTSLWPKWKEKGMPVDDADVIIITDDKLEVEDEMAAKFVRWKYSYKIKLHAIFLGSKESGPFHSLCDTYYKVRSLNLESDAVQSVLSI